MHVTTRRHGLANGLLGPAVVALALTGAACSTSAGSGTSTTSISSGASTASTASTSTTPTTSTTASTTRTTLDPPGGVIPADFQPSSFTAVSLDAWWMLGTARCLTGTGSCGAIVRTTDGGSSFVGIPSPPVSASAVTQLRFASALDGYAFDPELWATTNGGRGWTKVATPGDVTELEAAAGEGYALTCAPGSARCLSMELLRAQVGSSDWQKVSTPVSLGYHSQFALNGPNLYVLPGADHQVLMYSADKAASFSTRVDPCTAGLYCSITAAADGTSTLWSASPTGTEAGAWESNNGGMSWHSASPATAGFPNSLGLAAASSSVALARPGQQSSNGLPAALDRTTNGGKTYSGVLPSSWHVSWAGFSDPARAYCLAAAMETGVTGPSHLFDSNDGGATWHEVVIRS